MSLVKTLTQFQGLKSNYLCVFSEKLDIFWPSVSHANFRCLNILARSLNVFVPCPCIICLFYVLVGVPFAGSSAFNLVAKRYRDIRLFICSTISWVAEANFAGGSRSRWKTLHVDSLPCRFLLSFNYR